jgi:hypothetical protein
MVTACSVGKTCYNLDAKIVEKNLEETSQSSILQQRWTHAAFHCYGHLASIFISQIGLEKCTAAY